MTTNLQIGEREIRAAFQRQGIELASVNIRRFPNEVVLLVFVDQDNFVEATRISSAIEEGLPDNHLVVVRPRETVQSEIRESVKGVNDSRVSRLVELLNERSRTSEQQQPSLSFIRDAAENVRIAITRRHHVVFGRRGVGKTALLLEAKRLVEAAGQITLWQNMQVLRGLDSQSAFLTVARRICELPSVVHESRTAKPRSVEIAADLVRRIDRELSKSREGKNVRSLVAEIQRLVTLICTEKGVDLYIFLDDFHYLDMQEQPLFLDLLHGATRDTSAWIKVAGIRNQCKLYEFDPAIGMQIGHDAAAISLDITLEEPRKARAFLIGILQTYLLPAGITNRSGIFTNGALDRLVLASAGVPRDFLLLGARSIQLARERENARTVGTQDVNDAAGEAGAQKMSELEEDAASSRGKSRGRVNALNAIRSFAIDEHHFSFFRIDFREKNELREEYALLQSLMDLRMIHIVKGSLSEAHAAGERSEVYLIDLSEYSGSRLKKNISVIDLQGDNLILRRTGPKGSKTVADTPRKLVQIFRNGPLFPLTSFSPLVA